MLHITSPVPALTLRKQAVPSRIYDRRHLNVRAAPTLNTFSRHSFDTIPPNPDRTEPK